MAPISPTSPRLGTVRAKLTVLVGLPCLLMLLGLPALSALLHRELIDEVDDRVTEAERSLQLELDDDFTDLRLAARVLAEDRNMHDALGKKDAGEAKKLASVFGELYPDIDILVADSDGKVLAAVGPYARAKRLDEVPEMVARPAEDETRGITRVGCGGTKRPDFAARFIVARASMYGSIAVCQALDDRFLRNAAGKLGLEMVIVDGARENRVIARTAHFPDPDKASAAGPVPALWEKEKATFAVARLTPPWIPGERTPPQDGVIGLVAAFDVSDIRSIVKRHLRIGMGAVIVAALVSMFIGFRLASVMSHGLRQLTAAMRGLERHEYAHVENVKTGDEIEELAAGFNQMVDGLKERDKLRQTFGKYMTESVVEHLLAGRVQLGGVTLPVTILFSDIRSFTTISERMDAQSLVGLLNEYFTEMVSIVLSHDGVVDKYIGDAIMAVFGAPVPKGDPAEDAKNAVKAAVAMREALARLNERLQARGVEALQTGIGIHSGEVVAGNIGSERRMEYTVIGDAVNVASRLESQTKELATPILMSDATYALTSDVVEATPMRELHVKGRGQPIMTYALTGIRKLD